MSRVGLSTVWIQTIAVAVIAMLPSWCLAAKEFTMPSVQPAKTYPAHDQHPSEAVTIAVDPYDLADKANIFRFTTVKSTSFPFSWSSPTTVISRLNYPE